MTLLGTFSPYMVVHKSSVVKIDPSIPFEVACLVGCGVTTGYGSAVRSAHVRPGDDVVIAGIGGVGMGALQGALNAGPATSSPSTRSSGSATRRSSSAPRTSTPTSAAP